MSGEITSVRTESLEVAILIAAHNAATQWTAEAYEKKFAVIYQTIRSTVGTATPPLARQSAPDPRLDAGT